MLSPVLSSHLLPFMFISTPPGNKYQGVQTPMGRRPGVGTAILKLRYMLANYIFFCAKSPAMAHNNLKWHIEILTNVPKWHINLNL